jgi:hypothetical protein
MPTIERIRKLVVFLVDILEHLSNLNVIIQGKIRFSVTGCRFMHCNINIYIKYKKKKLMSKCKPYHLFYYFMITDNESYNLECNSFFVDFADC